MTALLSVDEYRRWIVESVPRLPIRTVALHEALGGFAAYDVRCHLELPPFDTAAMDGFAVRSGDLASVSNDNPAFFQVVGAVRMGQGTVPAVTGGQAVEVPTGGRVPPGADAVVPLEQCTVQGSTLTVHAPCGSGKNLRWAGEDLSRGQLVIPAGRRLQGPEIGALAAIGIGSPKVLAAPVVGVISTGDELVSPGQPLQPGQIYDSNSYLLSALAANLGARVVDCGRIRDDPGALLAALRGASAQVDLLVCSGGVSVGANDPVRRAISEGLQAECVNVAMKPGRPQAFGEVMGTPLIALPGNPASALVSFEVFVRPALCKMMGLAYQTEHLRAVVEEPVHGIEGGLRYIPVGLHRSSGQWFASAAGPRDSGGLSSSNGAPGLLRLLPGASLDRGDCAEVLMLDPHR